MTRINVNVNIPTFLTLLRLILAPLFLPALLVYLLPANVVWLNYVLAFLFVMFGLTDFFDGFLARHLKQETDLGRILDPIADKFLVYSTLIALLTVEKIYFYWVIIFIGREIFMMGLRQVAVEHGLTVYVSLLGKAKTFFQMALLTVIIANPYQELGLRGAKSWNGVEAILLVVSLVLTVLSAWQYYRGFMEQLGLPLGKHIELE